MDRRTYIYRLKRLKALRNRPEKKEAVLAKEAFLRVLERLEEQGVSLGRSKDGAFVPYTYEELKTLANDFPYHLPVNWLDDRFVTSYSWLDNGQPKGLYQAKAMEDVLTYGWRYISIEMMAKTQGNIGRFYMAFFPDGNVMPLDEPVQWLKPLKNRSREDPALFLYEAHSLHIFASGFNVFNHFKGIFQWVVHYSINEMDVHSFISRSSGSLNQTSQSLICHQKHIFQRLKFVFCDFKIHIVSPFKPKMANRLRPIPHHIHPEPLLAGFSSL